MEFISLDAFIKMDKEEVFNLDEEKKINEVQKIK